MGKRLLSYLVLISVLCMVMTESIVTANAKEINADYYAKDAMESVKIARSHFEKYNN